MSRMTVFVALAGCACAAAFAPASIRPAVRVPIQAAPARVAAPLVMKDEFMEVFDDVMANLPFLATGPVAGYILFEIAQDKGIIAFDGDNRSIKVLQPAQIATFIFVAAFLFLLNFVLFVPQSKWPIPKLPF